MKHSFLMCGTLGLCMEVLWTGCHSLKEKEFTLTGRSSIWMFPIYGMASVIGPLSHKLCRLPVLIRGSIYTAGIFLTEFTTGSILKKFHMCPWDYSRCPFQYKGLIRFDYAPVWFATGLFFEKLLTNNLEKIS